MGVDPQARELGMRAEALYSRLAEIEAALGVQEWWLLGRALPEARLLSEIASLLAVARAELETALIRVFGANIARAEPAEAEDGGMDAARAAQDPAWLAQRREQALQLLRMVALSLPNLAQYARMLCQYAEQYALPTAATEAFGIVADRLAEIGESLREPPR
jgi:citrate synthase